LVFVAALLLSPWVDERFLLALPLALWARRFIVAKEPLPRELALVCACVGPYLLLRIWVSFNGADATSGVFVRQCLTDFGHWAPSAPFGWWMAWRLAWLLPGWAAWSSWQAGSVRSIIIASGTAGAGMAMATFLAADLSRSAAMLLPGMLASFVLIVRRDPVLLSGWALALAGANLLVPAAHVVSMKIALISALPVELWRWAHL
jgi:hypothetical protein